MYVIYEGESLLIPATVTGAKNLISNVSCVIKAAKKGGGIPADTDTVLGTFSVDDYTSSEVTDGYLFTLINTSTMSPGVYWVNYRYNIGSQVFKGVPKRVTILEAGI